MATIIYVGMMRNGIDPNPEKKKEQGFFRRPMSEETRHRLRIEQKYEYKGNVCPECHTTKSLSGNHEC